LIFSTHQLLAGVQLQYRDNVTVSNLQQLTHTISAGTHDI